MNADANTGSGWRGIAIVWAIALLGAALVVTLAYSGAETWFGDSSRLGVFDALGVVLAASVIGALVVQFATRRPEGFVLRASWSVAGAAALVALAALAVAPIAAA